MSQIDISQSSDTYYIPRKMFWSPNQNPGILVVKMVTFKDSERSYCLAASGMRRAQSTRSKLDATDATDGERFEKNTYKRVRRVLSTVDIVITMAPKSIMRLDLADFWFAPSIS